jgi:hypothetical protein
MHTITNREVKKVLTEIEKYERGESGPETLRETASHASQALQEYQTQTVFEERAKIIRELSIVIARLTARLDPLSERNRRR